MHFLWTSVGGRMVLCVNGYGTRSRIGRWKCRQIRFFCNQKKRFLMGANPVQQHQKHLQCLPVVDHYVLYFIAFLTRLCFLGELLIQYLPVHNTHIRVGSCGRILSSLPHYVHDFVCEITLQDFGEVTLFELVLFLLAMLSQKKMTCAANGCLDLIHNEFRTRVIRGVPSFQLDGWESAGSNPACRTGVTIQTMNKAVEMLDRAKQRPIILNQLMAQQ